jgi:lysophospholipase L1-like esterase
VDPVLKTALWIALAVGFVPQVVWGQFCGQSYDARIAGIHRQAEQLPGHRPTLLLTGSSSIRLWPEAPEAFPQFEVINAGFGGSCYSDLWALRDTLLFAFEPDVVIVYEGDNDLSDGLPQNEILSSANALFADLAQRLPDTKVVVLAPKPSLARRHLEEECRLLSDALGQEARRHEFAFVDFWDAMHLADGTLDAGLFVGDGLHLNHQGYDAWVATLRRELPWLDPSR